MSRTAESAAAESADWPSAPADAAGRLAALRLARSPQVGPVTYHRLVRRFGDAASALAAAEDGAAPFEPARAEQAAAELAAGEALGARLLLLGEAAYPPLLAALTAPPPALWALGDPSLAARPTVAIVGARNASALGRRFAERVSAELVAAGWCVVSGLARGVDRAAHEGALAAGGATAAVLAGGADIVYPPEHAALHAEIAEKGLVLAEMPLGFQPQARHFPRRNHVVAGMSRGVVVVEGALKSGSLITARCALEAGREALACPGHPYDPLAAGPNQLLRDGAALVRGARDVIEALTVFAPQRAPMLDFAAKSPAPESMADADRAAQAADEAAAADEAREDAALDGADADPAERVWALLSVTPAPMDALARSAGLSAAAAAAAVSELEMTGRAVRTPGGGVARAAD